MQPYLTIALCYLIGSFPAARLVGRLWGVDPATQGSGNLGTTNILRLAGRLPGLLVFLTDLSKGWVAVLVAQRFGLSSPALEVALLAAVVGHIYPPWSRFKGGKGVATTAGVALLLTPTLAALALLIFAVVYGWRRLVSVASLVAMIALAAIGWGAIPIGWGEPRIGIATLYSAFALLAFWTHRQNLARLGHGTEPRTSL